MSGAVLGQPRHAAGAHPLWAALAAVRVLIERILYLEDVPNMQQLGKVQVGDTVAEQLELMRPDVPASASRWARRTYSARRSRFPGYDSLMGKDTATVAEILKQKGRNTVWFGKNHNVPDWQSSQAGPFDLWPTGLGFEYFYGFVGAETSQWRPAAFEGTKPIEPYLGNPDYNFDYDMADQAIKWVRNQKAVAPDRHCTHAKGVGGSARR